jgi:hypothetical protein
MKCLEKDRTRRYETANGLAADLQRHLDREPVVARPPSARYRFYKTWQRHKLALLPPRGYRESRSWDRDDHVAGHRGQSRAEFGKS